MALPVVSSLELYDVTHSTMRARWRPTEGASGYMLVYAPISRDSAEETEVKNSEFIYTSTYNSVDNRLYLYLQKSYLYLVPCHTM